jgi:hypothetical protein
MRRLMACDHGGHEGVGLDIKHLDQIIRLPRKENGHIEISSEGVHVHVMRARAGRNLGDEGQIRGIDDRNEIGAFIDDIQPLEGGRINAGGREEDE